MSHEIKVHLGNLTDKDVLVAIEDDVLEVGAKKSREICRESQKAPISVEVWVKNKEPKLTRTKEFSFDTDVVIRFCEFDGEVRFCEIDSLGPPAAFKLI
ncbi:MAG: hypothetical protein ACKVQJ_03805 [Pyrinomonadaceae bacterium]